MKRNPRTTKKFLLVYFGAVERRFRKKVSYARMRKRKYL